LVARHIASRRAPSARSRFIFVILARDGFALPRSDDGAL